MRSCLTADLKGSGPVPLSAVPAFFLENRMFITRPFRVCLFTFAGLGWPVFADVALANELGATSADSVALQRCRSLTDDRQRLACFDRSLPPLAVPGAAPGAALGAVAKTPPSLPLASTVLPAPAVGSGQPVAQPAPAAAAQFGLPRPRLDVGAQLTSRVVGGFDGWSRGRRIELANGQVWEFSDNSVGVYGLQEPRVTVQRGFLGSYFMEIEGVQQTPKVRRVK